MADARGRIPIALALLLPLVPLLVFASRFVVNVPYGDQWVLPAVFERMADGRVTFGDLFEQYNEHRLLAALPVIAALAFATRWSIGAEIALEVLLAGIALAGLQRLAGRDAGRSEAPWARLTTAFTTSVLIFSIVQWENWVLGIQISWFLIEAPLALGLVVLASRRLSLAVQVGLAALLCGIATFSEAHGLMSWPAMLPALLALPESRRRRAMWTFYGAASLVTLAYVVGWVVRLELVALPLVEPARGARFLLTVLGAPFARGSEAALIGAPAVGLLLLMAWFGLLLHMRRGVSWAVLAPWASLGLYALLFAAAVTAGRAFLGPEQAFAPRYAGHASLLAVAVIQLLRVAAAAGGVGARLRLGLVAALLVGSTLVHSLDVLPAARDFRQKLVRGRDCLEMIRYLDPATDSPESCLNLLAPADAEMTVGQLRQAALAIERVGLRAFGSALRFERPTETQGHLDLPAGPVQVPRGGRIALAGWAAAPGDGLPSRLVLISRDTEEKFLAAAFVGIPSPDVAAALGSNRYQHVRWATTLPVRWLPPGGATLHAWAYDKPGRRMVQLVGEAAVRVVDQAPP